ncbi:MAG: Thoeris anti-defense Tad2 family protein [Enterococcus lemanii]
MDIRKAIIEAKEQGRGIARREWGKRPPYIIVTNASVCAMFVDEKDQVTARWQPGQEDLIATDWYVYG